MPGHYPTLYPLPEHEDDNLHEDDDEGDDDGAWDVLDSRPSYPTQISSSNRPSTSRSVKLRPLATGSAPPHSTTAAVTLYSQFVRRYRSASLDDTLDTDDLRNDPDNYYFQRGLGQLVEAGDNSDDEDAGPSSVSVDGHGVPEAETVQPASQQEQERLEWQTLLASVLSGDVLKSEKTRIAVALETMGDEQNNKHAHVWLGIRAKFHGRSVEEERRRLEERRLRTVDGVLQEILTFRASANRKDPDATATALAEVANVLHRLDVIQSLYPNLKAFYLDKPVAAEPAFQSRCDTLNTWYTILTTLKHHFALLRRWTGSDTLDVTQPYTSREVPIGMKGRHNHDFNLEPPDGTSFVERLLKEESMQLTFEKGFLVTVHAFLGAARDAQVNLSPLFKEMNLPTFENELVPLISFPTRLAQASLRLRLDYVQKLRDPDTLIIDQMTEDVKLSIGLACTLKRQYEAILEPDPGGNWNLPQCISEDYDSSILEALVSFFKLIYWKLKSGAKGIYFKETDVLDAQWATFNDVSLSAAGGSCLVAEQLSSLTNRLLGRLANYFETQLRVPSYDARPHSGPSLIEAGGSKPQPDGVQRKMSDQQVVGWYNKVLDSVRRRHRKLQRFARDLTTRFSNSAEYSLDDVSLDDFISHLVSTDHFLAYTHTLEKEGVYIVASNTLWDRPDMIKKVLTEAFHADDVGEGEGMRIVESEAAEDEAEFAEYILILSPQTHFFWHGRVMMFNEAIPQVSLDTKDNRVRLVADGAGRRLSYAKQAFKNSLQPVDEDGEPLSNAVMLSCLVDSQAHLPSVNVLLKRIARTTNGLTRLIVLSVHEVRNYLPMTTGRQDLLANWYLFASEHGQAAHTFMERSSLPRFNNDLIKLSISWVSFICDECDPTDRKTFKWAVNALEFTLQRTKRNILHLLDDEFELLRHKVASCMTLLISHFDILGARSISEARKEKEKQEEMLKAQLSVTRFIEDDFPTYLNKLDGETPFPDPIAEIFWERASHSLRELERCRAAKGVEYHMLGKVLNDEIPEDRSLSFLASSSSNISIRWQQGKFIGAGAFGSVYLALNLDSGSLMAVKEIKFQELSGLPNLYEHIKDELSVMEMLHHPNVVEYYGIEVHRDKVYIFEEYCQGGSLAQLLEHGRIEDENIMQVYTMQMLEGLAYLHSRGVVHRDVKPDNILLDHMGVIKFVDFGAAKILAKNQRSIQRSRRMDHVAPVGIFELPALSNGLTGTPMYMSPEVIKNDRRGRHGAMDIWSLGCVVLEFATGKKPWSNLDNEWAIMFHIGVATQHPPLPEPHQLRDLGVNFIKQCLIIDPVKRPSAEELMSHPWMLELREKLLSYDEQEMA